MDYCASSNNLSACEDEPNYKFVSGDILSTDTLSSLMNREEIDTVLHFAAQTHVDNSFGNSLTFTMNNAYGTHVLLETCRHVGGIRRFINVSTDEVYGNLSFGKQTAITESSRVKPTNPYAAAKASAEMIANAYEASYKLPIITTRGNNVYGPRQFPEKLIPKFAVLLARGKPLPVHGDGLAARSFLHVHDVVKAFDMILHYGRIGEVYNIGGRQQRTVLEVAEDMCRLFGVEVEDALAHVRNRAFQDQRYFICDEKLAALGWKEETQWETGLTSTVRWYMEHGCQGWWDPAALEPALQPHPPQL
jgi:UDP-glucose 4,6-dehydratase